MLTVFVLYNTGFVRQGLSGAWHVPSGALAKLDRGTSRMSKLSLRGRMALLFVMVVTAVLTLAAVSFARLHPSRTQADIQAVQNLFHDHR